MKLNQYIYHTILKPAATAADVEAICREAVEYEFASVCVNTCHVRLVSRLLSGSPVKTCVVVGFPLGAMATEAKAFEAKHAVSNGAQEVDMVLNVGALKERNDSLVEQDIRTAFRYHRSGTPWNIGQIPATSPYNWGFDPHKKSNPLNGLP